MLTAAIRQQIKGEGVYAGRRHKWIILDSSIDSKWIESLNSVMDDNKLLTLASNDRIALTPEMRLIFETESLNHSTPATVSRGGVIYLNQGDLKLEPLVEKMLKRMKNLDQVTRNVVIRGFQTYVEALFDPASRLPLIFTPCLAELVESVFIFFEGLTKQKRETLARQREQPNEEESLRINLEGVLIQSVMWAIAGFVGGPDEELAFKKFNLCWRNLTKIKFPDSGHCLDYEWQVEARNWQHLRGHESTFLERQCLQVLTPDTRRLLQMLRLGVEQGRGLCLLGGMGCGKTTVLREFLLHLRDKQLFVNLHHNTTSRDIQSKVEILLDKKSNRVLGSISN